MSSDPPTTSRAVDAAIERIAHEHLTRPGMTPQAFELGIAAALAGAVIRARHANAPACEFREWDLDDFAPIRCPEPATHTVTRSGAGFPPSTRPMCRAHADREATCLLQIPTVDIDIEEIQ